MIIKGADYNHPVVLSPRVTARSFHADTSIKQTSPLHHLLVRCLPGQPAAGWGGRTLACLLLKHFTLHLIT